MMNGLIQTYPKSYWKNCTGIQRLGKNDSHIGMLLDGYHLWSISVLQYKTLSYTQQLYNQLHLKKSSICIQQPKHVSHIISSLGILFYVTQ